MSEEKHTPLLPCPFCRGDAQIQGEFDLGWSITCRQCAAGSGANHDQERLIAAWNARAEDPALPALVKALGEIAEFCSADASTLGAIDRLSVVQMRALAALALVRSREAGHE